jgi:hypothetical protein
MMQDQMSRLSPSIIIDNINKRDSKSMSKESDTQHNESKANPSPAKRGSRKSTRISKQVSKFES